jgi:hypothetical protein
MASVNLDSTVSIGAINDSFVQKLAEIHDFLMLHNDFGKLCFTFPILILSGAKYIVREHA